METRADKRASGRRARTDNSKLSQIEQAAKLAALDKVQAIIEFDLDGTVITANQNFLRTFGYSLNEIAGQRHRLFVDEAYAGSQQYSDFWRRLAAGEPVADEFKRLGKGGRVVWLQASYNPILDDRGRPIKVVKYATDITEQKQRDADFAGQVAAINKVQGVIEYDLDGIITRANDIFLKAFGYQLEEIVGKHNSIFVEPELARSREYAALWRRLREGHSHGGEYKRIGKDGREVWIAASYNPIIGMDGKPHRVVEFVTDMTQLKLRAADFEAQIAAFGKAGTVIEFDLDGTVRSANPNFLASFGYSLDEIVGKHHRMFVEPAYAASPEYEEFWRRLARGEHFAGEYKRIGKAGREVWIQGSYNPILDLNGKPFKVVKYATDITQQKQAFLELAGVISALSQGDLSAGISGEYQGEWAVIKEQMNATVDKLSGLVQQISQAAESVLSSARDISEGNTNLNSRTQEQSSALEETASSLEQLTATVKQTASNAGQANRLVSGARESAEKGGHVVGDAVEAMTAITESSRRVADIIGVIEQLAFQTNMLALNAAVEAARAGDQGRGFAVVAAEVRTLAQRSASAAKEIKALISDSQEKVERGAKLVNDSGLTLSQIVADVKTVTDIIGEIDAASEQQASGIDQINAAVAQMDKNTQQNAALVEQATAAAESLSGQSREMTELVGVFKLAGAASQAARPETSSVHEPSSQARGKANGGVAKGASAGPAEQRNGRRASRRPPQAPASDGDWKEF